MSFIRSRSKIRHFSRWKMSFLRPTLPGSTAEAQEAVGIQIALQVREYLKLGVVQNAVNLPSLSHEEYLEACAIYRHGWTAWEPFSRSFRRAVSRALSISYSGRIAEGKTDLIRNSAIDGILGHRRVSIASTPLLLRQSVASAFTRRRSRSSVGRRGQRTQADAPHA